MKKLLSILFLFVGLGTYAQTPQFLGSTNTNLIVQSLMTLDSPKSVFNLHLYDTNTTKAIYPTRLQYRLAREANGRLYQYIGSGFQLFDNVTGGGGGSYTFVAPLNESGGTVTINLSSYATTSALAAGLALAVKYADTTAMLSPYLRATLGVKYTDTAAMLASYNARINLKLNISDTANIKPRLSAGTNVTITGTYPSLTISASGGSSSTDTTSLSNRIDARVKYTDTAAMLAPYAKSAQVVKWTDTATVFAPYNTRINNRIPYTDTGVRVASTQNLKDTAVNIRYGMLPSEYQSYIKYLTAKGFNLYGKTIYVYGDSYTMGTGASSSFLGFMKYLESWYGCTFILIGADGATISKRSPVITSSTNFVDAMTSLPMKNANNPFLWVMAGVNDYGVNNASGTWILSNYITDYTTGLNTANSKGYQNQDILVTSPWWIPFQGRNYYNTIFSTGIPTTAHCDSYAVATEALMTSRNIAYINMYGMMKYGDTNTFVLNHPNDRGHWDIARAINATIGGQPISFSTQTFSSANIVYNSTVNLSNAGVIWSPTSGSGGYGTSIGLSNQFVPANSDFRMSINGTTSFGWAGVRDSNLIGTGYNTSRVAIAVAAGDVYFSVNGSGPAPTSPVSSIASTDSAILQRVGSVYTIIRKTAAGVETLLQTVGAYTSTGAQYLTADVAGAFSGHLDNPRISIYGAYATGDNKGAIDFSKGGFKGQNQNAEYLRFDSTTQTLVLGTTTGTGKSIDLQSPTQAFYVNHGTTAQRTALTPSERAMFYDDTLHKMYVWDGTLWQPLW